MATAKAKWKGDKLMASIEGGFKTNLLKAAEQLRSQVVRNLSKGSTREQGPSSPGDFPHVDFGELRGSVFSVRAADDHAVVGFTAEHGLFHELGARPFLKRTFDEIKNDLKKTMTKKPKFKK